MELDVFKKKFTIVFCTLASFAIVSLGQPAFVKWLGVLSAFFGYALFWQGLSFIKRKKTQFFLSWSWFAAVHAVGIDWMSSTAYVGNAMFLVYFFMALAVGAQFAIASSVLFFKKKFSLLNCFAFASIWAFFEWIRLFFFSGYSWNPAGLALATNSFSVQWASLFGIFGLSFWVMLTNAIGWRALFFERSKFLYGMWVVLFGLPFAYGFFQTSFQNKAIQKSPTYSVALVQTSFFPEERTPLLVKNGQHNKFLTPWDHWKKILRLLKENVHTRYDFIVLPEVAVPVPAHLGLYSFPHFQKKWEKIFQTSQEDFFPVLHAPEDDKKTLSNVFIAQTLANFFESEVIIGLEDYDPILRSSCNAAFFLQPFSSEVKRYKKQVLVPIVEYFPFSWCGELAKRYGICDAFSPGKEPKVFFGDTTPVGLSICYEETYGNLMRKNRLLGAKLFVNISNDVWFPHSRLPRQHFELGRIRAIENGVPLIRACNTGLTIAVDSLGCSIASLEKKSQEEAGVLLVKIPSHHYTTLYTYFGDSSILAISLFWICFFLKRNLKKDFFSR